MVHVVSGVGAPGDLRLQLGRGGHVVVPGVRPAHCPAHRPGVAAVLGGGGGGEGGAPHPVAVPEGGRRLRADKGTWSEKTVLLHYEYSQDLFVLNDLMFSARGI